MKIMYMIENPSENPGFCVHFSFVDGKFIKRIKRKVYRKLENAKMQSQTGGVDKGEPVSFDWREDSIDAVYPIFYGTPQGWDHKGIPPLFGYAHSTNYRCYHGWNYMKDMEILK